MTLLFLSLPGAISIAILGTLQSAGKRIKENLHIYSQGDPGGGVLFGGSFLTVKHISKTSRAQLYFHHKSVSADLPGIMTQAHSVRDVVHTHGR